MNNESNNNLNTGNNFTNIYSNNVSLQSPTTNKKNEKKVVLIVIALCIIGLSILAFFYFNRNSGEEKQEIKTLNSIFDSDKPIVVKKDGLYGYITADGKTIIEPKYKSADNFNDGYAVVSIDNPDTTSYNEVIYQLIDKKGNVKSTEEIYSKPMYYSQYGIWEINDELYNTNLKKILANGYEVDYIGEGYFAYENNQLDEAGIIDYKGKKKFNWAGSYIYTDISDTTLTEDDFYFRVEKNEERDGIVSAKTGKLVYSVDEPENFHIFMQDDNIIRVLYNNSDNLKTLEWVYFKDGKIAYKTTEDLYELEVYDYSNNILKLDYGYKYEEKGKNQEVYYYDITNKKLLDKAPSYDEIDINDIDLTELTYGYKIFNSSSKYGLMKDGKVFVPSEYDTINFVNSNLYKYMHEKDKDLVYLKKDKTTILMDLKKQETLTIFDSTYVTDYDSNTFIKATIYEDYKIKEYVIYNLLSNKSMTFNSEDPINLYSNYLTVTKNNTKIYYNTELEQIYTGDI